MSFSGDVAKFRTKVQAKTETQFRAVLFEMFARIIQRSPVDTGRFRGNWQVSLDNPRATPTEDTASAEAGVMSDLAVVPVGRTVWLANAVSYAIRLEYGWSQQAPAGMVRLTAAEFSDIVSNA